MAMSALFALASMTPSSSMTRTLRFRLRPSVPVSQALPSRRSSATSCRRRSVSNRSLWQFAVRRVSEHMLHPMLSALLISPKPTSFPLLLLSLLTSRVLWAVITRRLPVNPMRSPRLSAITIVLVLQATIFPAVLPAVLWPLPISDTIAGMFAIGEPPTGSKDPFRTASFRYRCHQHLGRSPALRLCLGRCCSGCLS